jgi:hypothetical protein
MINKRANNQLQIETVTYTNQELQNYSKLVFDAYIELKDIINDACYVVDISCVNFQYEFRKQIARIEIIEWSMDDLLDHARKFPYSALSFMKKMISYAKKNLPNQKDLDQFNEDIADMCRYLDENRRDYRDSVL